MYNPIIYVCINDQQGTINTCVCVCVRACVHKRVCMRMCMCVMHTLSNTSWFIISVGVTLCRGASSVNTSFSVNEDGY